MPVTLRRRLLLQGLGLLSALPARGAAPRLRFPRDFGAHPDTRLEWWYLTGLLADPGDAPDATPRFGYQLTFFRLKGPAPADHPSALAARQLLLGHAALSDLRSGRLRHDQRIARALPGLAEASEQDCAVRLRDWSLRRTPEGYRAELRAATGFALQLQLRTTQPVLLQGDQGLSRKGPQPQQFSHYYSQVQLATEAALELDGGRRPLQGRSWLDHEWSDQLLGATGQDRAVGWDWLGINLADGGALTAFRLRRADGSVLWTGGSWRRADGSTQDFAPGRLSMDARRRWTSPASGAAYPVEWTLQTPLGLLRLNALADAQEVDARASTGMMYWEGAAALYDAQGARIGLGYLELTGYAAPMTIA